MRSNGQSAAGLLGGTSAAALLALQRSAGNRAVQRLLAVGRLQRQGPAVAQPAPAPPAGVRLVAREPVGGTATPAAADPAPVTSIGGQQTIPLPWSQEFHEQWVAAGYPQAAGPELSSEDLEQEWDEGGLGVDRKSVV